MSVPFCTIHNKEMKPGKFGWFCATPIEKSADGKTVLKWCDFKVEDTVKTIPDTNIEQKTKEIREILTKEHNTTQDRIERQHSQQMSLKYLEITEAGDNQFSKAGITLEKVKELTDWFVADLDSPASNKVGD